MCPSCPWGSYQLTCTAGRCKCEPRARQRTDLHTGRPHPDTRRIIDFASAIVSRDTTQQTAHVCVRIAKSRHAWTQTSFSQPMKAFAQTGLEATQARTKVHKRVTAPGVARIHVHSWQPGRLPESEAAPMTLPSASALRWRSAPLDNACARRALRMPRAHVQEDGPARTASTRGTVSKGWPSAWAPTAALEHRQHRHADELIMLPSRSLNLRCGTRQEVRRTWVRRGTAES